MPERILKILMPPKTGASDEQLYFWRVTMAVVLSLTILMTCAHMAWSVGALPFFAGQGFVRQTEFQKLADATTQARRNTLQVSITDTKRSQCKAKGEYRNNLLDQITKLLLEWKELTGDDFPVPRCEDMG